MAKPKILIIEDDPDGARSVREAVEDMDYETLVAMTGEDGVRAFSKNAVDAVLSDLVLPDIDGVEVLSRIRRENPDVPVMIMTAHGSVPSAVNALKSGAYDYITKPLDLDDLQSKVRRAVETSRLRRKVLHLESSIQDRYVSSTIVAESSAMKQVLQEIKRLKDNKATVLVQGESGVGKEVVARALHADGNRRRGPFVAVNCGALSETILESELFGHEKGAFTGAVSRRQGAFERADGGTLFLDEVGNASSSVQIKLLRVLEERQILRVGGQVQISVDVRLISASNRDLDELVAEGEFREDLLYRLKVVTLYIPPLRERRGDIRPLVDRFLVTACADHGRHIVSVDPDAYTALESFDWAGNVRQLRNVMESAVIMADSTTIHVSDLRLPGAGATPDSTKDGMHVPDNKTFAEMEKEILSQLLRRHDGNRTLVADKLGVSRRTIQRKVKEYDLPY